MHSVALFDISHNKKGHRRATASFFQYDLISAFHADLVKDPHDLVGLDLLLLFP